MMLLSKRKTSLTGCEKCLESGAENDNVWFSEWRLKPINFNHRVIQFRGGNITNIVLILRHQRFDVLCGGNFNHGSGFAGENQSCPLGQKLPEALMNHFEAKLFEQL